YVYHFLLLDHPALLLLRAFPTRRSADPSRRRFWEGAESPEGASAFATLYECLETLTRLMAPIVPFITDHVWDVIRPADGPESVHLADWPVVNEDLLDEELTEQMALVRRLVELGRSARAA